MHHSQSYLHPAYDAPSIPTIPPAPPPMMAGSHAAPPDYDFSFLEAPPPPPPPRATLRLPKGWASAIDPEGETYYYNAATKQSQYEQPTAESTLPRGWASAHDSKGETYYYNKETLQSQYEKPTTPSSEPPPPPPPPQTVKSSVPLPLMQQSMQHPLDRNKILTSDELEDIEQAAVMRAAHARMIKMHPYSKPGGGKGGKGAGKGGKGSSTRHKIFVGGIGHSEVWEMETCCLPALFPPSPHSTTKQLPRLTPCACPLPPFSHFLTFVSLASYFSKFGRVVDSVVMKDAMGEPRLHQGFGYIDSCLTGPDFPDPQLHLAGGLVSSRSLNKKDLTGSHESRSCTLNSASLLPM